MLAVLVATLLMAGSTPQPAREARVTVTVVDQTGAVIPNATVTIAPVAVPKTPLPPAKTGDKGIAVITGLTPGRYSIQADFTGFASRLLRDVQLRAGDNKHALVLALQNMEDSVTVSRDAREAASD